MKITSLITAGILGAALASQAALLDWTAGLAEDAEYRIVFLTSTTTQATSTDIGIYNAFVNAAADLNSELDAISWAAIGSTATVNVRDNTGTTALGTGIAIYTITGNLVATDYTDLYDGLITNNITVNEQGAGNIVTSAWTGTSGTGLTSGGSPLGGATTARAGNPTQGTGTSGWWLNRIGATKTNSYSMYAMSEVLTVTVAVPEPSSFALLGGLLSLGFVMVRRRR